MNKLKPCPFCGSKAEESNGGLFLKTLSYKTYGVACSNNKCKVQPITSQFKTKKTAIKWWNKRPIEDELEGYADELYLEMENMIE